MLRNWRFLPEPMSWFQSMSGVIDHSVDTMDSEWTASVNSVASWTLGRHLQFLTQLSTKIMLMDDEINFIFALKEVHLHRRIHKTVILIIFFENNCTHTMVNEIFGIFVEVGSSGIVCCLPTIPVMWDIVDKVIIFSLGKGSIQFRKKMDKQG